MFPGNQTCVFGIVSKILVKLTSNSKPSSLSVCVCLCEGDFSQGKRKGVTVYLGEVFELHLSVDGTLSHGAERYKTDNNVIDYKNIDLYLHL